MKIHNYFKNMAEENVSLEFRLRNIDETRNYIIEEINQNQLMSKKHKKYFTALNYIEHFLICGSTITLFLYLFLLLSWYSFRNYEFCSWINDL